MGFRSAGWPFPRWPCGRGAGAARCWAALASRPGYVLTDGFPVRGLAVPALAMWKGDEVAACVAAASIVAKVTRDRIMKDLSPEYPEYGFSRHKGYSTPSHMAALTEHGPCPQHRASFANVIGVMRARAGGAAGAVGGRGAGVGAGRDRRHPAAPAQRERSGRRERMSAEDLEKYETEMELQLYREYRDVVGLFSHVVETERRFYLTNQVELNVRTSDNGEVFFEVTMQDAWVWDMYRPARFVKNVRVVTFKDVKIAALAKADLEFPSDKPDFPA